MPTRKSAAVRQNRSNKFNDLISNKPSPRLFVAGPSDWCFGSKQFRADMLDYIERQRGKWHYGSELWQSSQAKAEHLIAEVLSSEGIPAEQLGRWRKGHPFKIELAMKLRAQTTVTLDWIAKRFKMGKRGHLAHLLYLNAHERVGSPKRSSTQLGFKI